MPTQDQLADLERFTQQARRMGYGALIDDPQLLKRTIWGLVAERSNNRHRREMAIQMRDGTMKSTDIARIADYQTAIDKDAPSLRKLDYGKLVAANGAAMKQQGMDPDGDGRDDKELKPRDKYDKFVRDAIADHEKQRAQRERG